MIKPKNAKPLQSVQDIMVKHEGSQIVLPVINGTKLPIPEAITWLQRKQEEEQKILSVYEEIECSPLDGLIAFHKAVSKIYGWTDMVPTPGFFGDKPPVMISVPVSDTETLQVPYGRMQIPGIDGFLATQVDGNREHPCFIIVGEVKNKNKEEVIRISTLTRDFLRNDSIYKGKAVKVDFSWEPGNYDIIQNSPQFMSLDGIDESSLIFSQETMDSIDIGLFTPIEQADACRKYQIPLKRGILLYGVYGTGKTMTSGVAAVKAVRNGWTFIYLNNVIHLKKALEFAQRYAPAVLFSEDIDRALTGDRSIAMDEILNTLDGVDTKGAEIITVFTTNHVENINPAALRMGRLDTLVHVTPPDAKAAERLIKLYSRGLLEPTASIAKVAKELAGNIPAFIREVAERAKIAAISRRKGEDIAGHVLEEDLLSAANAMRNHSDMLKPREKKLPDNMTLQLNIPAGNKNVDKILKECTGTQGLIEFDTGAKTARK